MCGISRAMWTGASRTGRAPSTCSRRCTPPRPSRGRRTRTRPRAGAGAGPPPEDELARIAALEPFDRGRYAGPVGWVDASGDGEWAVALRCAQVDDDGTVTGYAGAGIVGGSDPERELAETSLKLRPILEAFA